MIDYKFDIKNITEDCTTWIRNWFEENGKECNAVIGISGGKDSSVVAALCVKALGRDRVIGVLMPNGNQPDISDAYQLCDYLGIDRIECSISTMYLSALNSIKIGSARRGVKKFDISEQTKINLPARLRMSMLYAISQSCNGRVANTCNLSEDWIGYSTRYGDSVGDFAPLSQLTSDEVVKIGEYLGLPDNLIYKIPADGLTNKSDEDNFGFTYAVLNRYIRTGICEDEEIKSKIDKLHKKNLFKLMPMQYFNSNLKTIKE